MRSFARLGQVVDDTALTFGPRDSGPVPLSVLDLAPVLLGSGVRLFDHLGTQSIELEAIRVVDSPGVTHLRYRVVK